MRHEAGMGALVALALLVAACTSGDDDAGRADARDASQTTTSTTLASQPLRVLVTNDDGVGAPGIDGLVEGLRTLPDVEVVVVAPAENRSGTGGTTSDGPLRVVDATTASGHPAKAVEGFPADAIVWAIDRAGVGPVDLVISGVNAGQNLGIVVDISGTVGAARAAVARGVPALAVSQGLGDPPDYETGVQAALAWIREHRDALEVEVVNLNIPTCTSGSVRGVVEVPVAGEGVDPLAPADCTSALEDPAHDVEAFVNGFIARTDLAPAE